MASAYVARSYGSAYTLGFKIKNNNQKQYISSFGVIGLLTDLKSTWPSTEQYTWSCKHTCIQDWLSFV